MTFARRITSVSSPGFRPAGAVHDSVAAAGEAATAGTSLAAADGASAATAAGAGAAGAIASRVMAFAGAGAAPTAGAVVVMRSMVSVRAFSTASVPDGYSMS